MRKVYFTIIHTFLTKQWRRHLFSSEEPAPNSQPSHLVKPSLALALSENIITVPSTTGNQWHACYSIRGFSQTIGNMWKWQEDKFKLPPHYISRSRNCVCWILRPNWPFPSLSYFGPLCYFYQMSNNVFSKVFLQIYNFARPAEVIGCSTINCSPPPKKGR